MPSPNTATSIATNTPAIIQEMRELHPNSPVPQIIGDILNMEIDTQEEEQAAAETNPVPFNITLDAIESTLKKTKLADCAGCDNFHPLILLSMLNYSDTTITEPVKKEYVKYLNDLIKDGYPAEYNIGIVHGLLKNPTEVTSAHDAKLRPIAIDSSHSRLVNKILHITIPA